MLKGVCDGVDTGSLKRCHLITTALPFFSPTHISTVPIINTNCTGPSQLLPSLDTSRSLERFRNQVLLSQWVDRRWHGVRRVMEDAHRMWLIRPRGRLQAKELKVKRTQVRTHVMYAAQLSKGSLKSRSLPVFCSTI